MKRPFLFEIGCEEIPASFLEDAARFLKDSLKKFLSEKRVEYKDLKSFYTPRRIAILIKELSLYQKPSEKRVIGPPKKIAFDESGNPTKAAYGFCRSVGVDIEELKTVKTSKGEYVFAIKREKEEPTSLLLSGFLPKLISSFPFKKSMRWDKKSIKFARPIRWILALFGDEVISFSIDGIKAKNVTFGHRFLYPKPITIDDPLEYEKKLKEAAVVPDPEERRSIIEDRIDKISKSVKGFALKDESLLNEVTNLLEYPYPVLGNFPKEFLDLPKDVIVSCMVEHQRVFPIENKEGKLLPYFVSVLNIKPKDEKLCIKGNERVLCARLSDALFFFNEDIKEPLSKKVLKLSEITFKQELGSMYDKVKRLEKLSLYINSMCKTCDEEKLKRAAFLCKADLVTHMVYEFPNLQGKVGSIYAKICGEDEEVCRAIYEHYLPEGEKMPDSNCGVILSISDKFDTLFGFLSLGLYPSGAHDPYGMRRAALGILRVIMEKELDISLSDILNRAKEIYQREADVEKMVDFIVQRESFFFKEKGFPKDHIDACLTIQKDRPMRAKLAIFALSKLESENKLLPLSLMVKRISNITKGFRPKRDVREDLFVKEEKELYDVHKSVRDKVLEHFSSYDYLSVFHSLERLKEPLDRFFDNVLVMDENEMIRENRLTLLCSILDTTKIVCDLSKLKV